MKLKMAQVGAGQYMTHTELAAITGVNVVQAYAGHHTTTIEPHTVAARTAHAAETAQRAGFKECFIPDQTASPERQSEEIRDFIVESDFDLVRICTTDPSHAFFAIPALAAGKHVFCEKALAGSLEDGLLMVEAARQSKASALVQYNYPWMDALQLAADLVKQGRVVGDGCVYGAQMRFLQDWCIGAGGQSNWRHHEKPWGVLADLGSHMLSVLDVLTASLNDPIDRVSADIMYYEGADEKLRLHGPDIGDPDNLSIHSASFTLKTKRNCTITGETGRHHRVSKADLGIELFGIPGGKLRWNLANQPKLYFTEHTDVPSVEVGEKEMHMDSYVPGLTGGFEKGHGNQLLAWLRWRDGGYNGPCPGTSFEQALYYLRVIEAIRQAGISGEVVYLDECQG